MPRTFATASRVNLIVPTKSSTIAWVCPGAGSCGASAKAMVNGRNLAGSTLGGSSSGTPPSKLHQAISLPSVIGPTSNPSRRAKNGGGRRGGSCILPTATNTKFNLRCRSVRSSWDSRHSIDRSTIASKDWPASSKLNGCSCFIRSLDGRSSSLTRPSFHCVRSGTTGNVTPNQSSSLACGACSLANAYVK